jgi:sulfur transfer complex TusBCD TusB component (DsrH family)
VCSGLQSFADKRFNMVAPDNSQAGQAESGVGSAAANTTHTAAKTLRFLVVFSGDGYAADAIAHLVAELEGKGHQVEWVSYAGLAAETAKSVAKAGVRGIKAALRTVTGKLMGDDPFGLAKEQGSNLKFDAIIATSPELAMASKILAGSKTLRAGLMTDLGWDPQWTASENDILIVSHPLFREFCLQHGWRYESVFIGGVPLPRPFCRPLDVEALRARFGLNPEKGNVLMVIAEDIDPGRLERIVFQLSLTERPMQPIFYTGENPHAAATLRAAASKYGVTARMFGKVDNLEEFYATSDAVLLQIDNPLLYPLLALDKPALLIDADIHARPLGAFLRDEAAAVLVPDLLRLSAELDAIFNHPEELERLRAGAEYVVDQKGVPLIIEALEAAAANPDQYIGLARLTPPTPDAPPTSAPSGGGDAGPFEVIGSTPSAPPPQNQNPNRPHTPHTPEYVSPLTLAEAREQLASIILEERRIDSRLSDATRLARQWQDRLELAQQAAEPSLTAEASKFAQYYARESDSLQRELNRLRDQKDKLKRRVARPVAPTNAPPSAPEPPLDTERRFRDMEVDRDLERLKSRLNPRKP